MENFSKNDPLININVDKPLINIIVDKPLINRRNLLGLHGHCQKLIAVADCERLCYVDLKKRLI